MAKCEAEHNAKEEISPVQEPVAVVTIPIQEPVAPPPVVKYAPEEMMDNRKRELDLRRAQKQEAVKKLISKAF